MPARPSLQGVLLQKRTPATRRRCHGDSPALGRIDVAFVWGPIAGYFARKAPVEVAVVPFPANADVRMDFPISMGVRFGEREWKERIDSLVQANLPRIQAILADYGVPQLAITPAPPP